MQMQMRIRITVHGALYALTGLLLLTAGLLRGELLSTALGGLLTLYTGFAALAVGCTAFYWRHEEPSVSLTESSVAGNDAAAGCGVIAVSPAAAVFPRCAVGAAASYTLSFSRTPDPAAEAAVQMNIPLHVARTVYHTESVPRGRYFYRQQYLAFKDLCGFFAVQLMQPRSVSRVYTGPPRLQPFEAGSPPELSARTAQDVPQLERTAELYESRPYFPGDDPRKIHWKLYAHTGGLSIKLGAFEPPPVKHVSIYIEAPRVLRKQDQKLVEDVFDAFVGRLASFILQLLNTGRECSLLLYDYRVYDYRDVYDSLDDYEISGGEAPVHKARKNSGGMPLQRFDILPDDRDALSRVLNLCAIPAVQSVRSTCRIGAVWSCCRGTALSRRIEAARNAWKMRETGGADSDAAAVFRAVPEESGLLYCYLPLPDSYAYSRNGISGAALKAAELKAAESRRAGVETVFYLADIPALHEAPRVSGGAPRVSGGGDARSRGLCSGFRGRFRQTVHRLLYCSAASLRQEAFYRRYKDAAERELRFFAARNDHALLF